jgi:uncharacterized protein
MLAGPISRMGHEEGLRFFIILKEESMPLNNDNINDQKQGGSVSNRDFASIDEGEQREIASEGVHDDGSGQHARRSAQGNQNGTNSGTGSTRGSSSEQHTAADRKGSQRSHSGSGQHSNESGQGNQNQGTNNATGSTRGGSFEQYAKRSQAEL